MKTRVAIATLVVSLFLIGSVLAAVPAPSSGSGTAIGASWVRKGKHGDAFDHNTAAACVYGDPIKTVFGPNDPLWMRVYVTTEYVDTFHGTFYAWNKTQKKFSKSDFDYNIGDPAGNWCICAGWAAGVGLTGEWLFFAKVTTALGATSDFRFPPFEFTVQ